MSTETQHNHEAIIARLNEMERNQLKRFEAIEAKLNPIYTAWTSVSGFNQISIWLFKFLLGLGAAIGALYVIIEFFKRLSK